MFKLKINDTIYTNIGTIEKDIERYFYHDVQTLDGKIHRDLRGLKTNYTVLFFNDLQGNKYDNLKRLLESGLPVSLSLIETLPTEEERYLGEFMPTIKGDEIKGLLWSGKYYETALEVEFKLNGYEVVK